MLGLPASGMPGSDRIHSDAIGIDLGTSHCVLSVWDNAEQKPTVLADEFGNRLIPSVIAYDNHERRWLFGAPAKAQKHRNPSNTVYNCKLLLGRDFDDVAVQRMRPSLAYAVVSRDGRAAVRLTIDGEPTVFYPEELMAKLLDYLCAQASATLVRCFAGRLRTTLRLDASKRLGLRIDESCTIVDVPSGTEAERVGLQKGWQIKAVEITPAARRPQARAK